MINKLLLRCVVVLGIWCMSVHVQAQLPVCNYVYFHSQTGQIRNYDPTLPYSGTNPVLNTLPPTPGASNSAGGLTVCPILGSSNSTLTFYTTVNNNYYYYNYSTSAWVNTGHSVGNGSATNIAAGGGYIYNLVGATGQVYKYDGTGNGALLTTVPGFASVGPYDLVADCEGNWYIFNQTGSSPFLKKYSPTGILLQSWTYSNPNNISVFASGGFAINGNTLYTDNSFNNGIAVYTLGATTLTLNSTTTLGVTNIGDLGSCAGTVPTPPGISITASQNSVCAGTTVTFTATTVAGGATPAYQWYVNGIAVGTNAATYSYIPVNGDVVYVVLTSSSPCASVPTATSNSVTMTVLQPGPISGLLNVCAGSTQTYSIGTVSGATSYAWTIPPGWSLVSGQGTTSITVTIGSAGGNVSVTSSSSSCGQSAAQVAAVNVITTVPAPGPVSGNTVFCGSAPQTYSIAAMSGATSYSWSVPSGWVITSGSGTTSITVTPAAGSGSVSVSAIFPCGTSPASTLSVTYGTVPPSPGSITGNTPVCAGSANTYTVQGVSGASSYIWTLPSGWSGASSTASINTTAGTAGGIITVSAANGCGASAATTFTVAVNQVNLLTTPGPISGQTSPCATSMQTYSVMPVSGASSYTWTGPNGWTGSSTTPSITYTTSGLGGTVQVVANSAACGSSAPSSLVVLPLPLVTPAVTISTPATSICQSAGATFTAAPANGGATPTYQWKKNGSNVGANSSTYSDYQLVSGDVITVVMTSSAPCANTPTATSNTLTMTVVPAIVSGININSMPPTVLCAGTPLTFVSNITGGGSSPAYQWYLNGVQIPGATGSNYTSSTIATGDTLTVTLTSSACAAPPVVTSNKMGLTVQPVVVPTISVTATPGTTVGAGTTVTFTASYTGGGPTPVLQWKKNGQNIPFATGSTYTTSGLSDGDLISVNMISYAPCPSPLSVTSVPLRMNVATGISGSNANWQGSLLLYPNPSNGRFTIEAVWGSGHSGERVTIALINALGQTVWTEEVVPNTATWSVNVWLQESVANGVYMLRLRSNDRSAVRQVLLQR